MVTKGDREKTIVFFFANFKEGGEAMDFDYFYNREAERFNFLKDPKNPLQYVALEITIHK